MDVGGQNWRLSRPPWSLEFLGIWAPEGQRATKDEQLPFSLLLQGSARAVCEMSAWIDDELFSASWLLTALCLPAHILAGTPQHVPWPIARMERKAKTLQPYGAPSGLLLETLALFSRFCARLGGEAQPTLHGKFLCSMSSS